MASTCVVGLQWGDEAKGKIVDLLTADHDVVVRYNGGANAGHTVVRNGKSYKLSLLPTGVLSPNLYAVIANGVVVHPVKFIEESAGLRAAGIPIGDNLILSDHAHLIFPYHIEEERLCEAGAESAIGTTGRGIGPCYQDKVGRSCGIRVGELLYPEHFRERLRTIVPRKNKILTALSSEALRFEADALCDQYLGFAEELRPHIRDTALFLHQALREGKRLLFEAAQGSLLDVDHGSYPYVTSSNSSTAGVWAGTGVPARNLTRVIGVIKAYTSRVGRGPFPTIYQWTPYESSRDRFIEWGVWFARRGYAAVVQDCRGRYESEGEFHAYVHDGADAVASLDWAAGEAWCNGRIGTWGRSYG
ncbi:MAG: adenylosuccinate synthetase, partial [Planctomycetes bacterium]|nr:adenylosuccinate synthetase [Planctomycetota bacterium]